MANEIKGQGAFPGNEFSFPNFEDQNAPPPPGDLLTLLAALGQTKPEEINVERAVILIDSCKEAAAALTDIAQQMVMLKATHEAEIRALVVSHQILVSAFGELADICLGSVTSLHAAGRYAKKLLRDAQEAKVRAAEEREIRTGMPQPEGIGKR